MVQGQGGQGRTREARKGGLPRSVARSDPRKDGDQGEGKGNGHLQEEKDRHSRLDLRDRGRDRRSQRHGHDDRRSRPIRPGPTPSIERSGRTERPTVPLLPDTGVVLGQDEKEVEGASDLRQRIRTLREGPRTARPG